MQVSDRSWARATAFSISARKHRFERVRLCLSGKLRKSRRNFHKSVDRRNRDGLPPCLFWVLRSLKRCERGICWRLQNARMLAWPGNQTSNVKPAFAAFARNANSVFALSAWDGIAPIAIQARTKVFRKMFFITFIYCLLSTKIKFMVFASGGQLNSFCMDTFNCATLYSFLIS